MEEAGADGEQGAAGHPCPASLAAGHKARGHQADSPSDGGYSGQGDGPDAPDRDLASLDPDGQNRDLASLDAQEKAAVQALLDGAEVPGLDRRAQRRARSALKYAALVLVAGVAIGVGDGNDFDDVGCGVAAQPQKVTYGGTSTSSKGDDGDGKADSNGLAVGEHAERMWLPQRHATAVKAMLARRGLQLSELRRFVAGADVFSRQADGTTIAQQYLREGIKLRPANMDRINGWAEILQMFGDDKVSILPKLFIHQRCGRLVETVPAMQHDPHRPEDVLKVDCDEEGVGGDDAADCLRYLVATRARTVTQRKLRGV